MAGRRQDGSMSTSGYDLSPILLVDDNLDTLYGLERASRQVSVQRDVHVALDGHQAIGSLRQGLLLGARVPTLMLLRLGCAGAIEALHWTRHQPALDGMRILLLCDGESTAEVSRALLLGADACLERSDHNYQLIAAVRQVHDAWLAAA